MPPEATLSHRTVKSANLPYVSNLSPTATDPCFIPGSQNVLTSINGYAQRRPGFADTVEPTPTTFLNLKRLFSWDRTDGTFIEMACDVTATTSTVYKRLVASDLSFVSIYTDTTSGTPFDFVVSNNTLYFSNGHVAKKWDPINGVSNWGIAAGSVNSASGPNLAGAGADAGGGAVAWTNPNNVTSAVAYATASVSGFDFFTNILQATQYAFGISGASTILGIMVAIDTSFDYGTDILQVTLLKGGSRIGTTKLTNPVPAGPQTITFGGAADLWGTSWTPNDINQTTFGVSIQCVSEGPGAHSVRVKNVRITVNIIGGPVVVVNAGAGTMTATIGYQYVFCFGNSNTGHLSSPSPTSASTGAFANKLKTTITLVASTDPQVNQIRVFRSTDSVAANTNAGTFFELPNSPFPNTAGGVDDNAPDTSLIITSLAPIPGFNDPPTPGQCPVYFSGRVWMQTANLVWFSGLEEILQGVPEESWPSGIAGNFWRFDQTVNAQAVAGTQDSQGLIDFSGGRLNAITGNSLDTFRRFNVSQRRGCRAIPATSTLGGMVAWLDSANQIWSTDGATLQELSLPIRPDIASVTPANCSMTFHVAGNYHWLVFSTGTQLFVYDLDTSQWMPPWTFACQYLWSGEVAPGDYRLMASTGTKAVQLSITGANNDQTVTYPMVMRTANMAVVPDFGTRFSYAAVGAYDEPSRTGLPWIYQVDTNQPALADIAFLADDDPLDSRSVYTSVFQNQQPIETVFNRSNGTYLRQNAFPVTAPVARWISLQIEGKKADDNLKVYGYYMGYGSKR